MVDYNVGVLYDSIFRIFRKETKMKMRIIVVAVTLLMLLTSALFLTGCNTWKGFGKDMETTGEKMQK